MHRPTLRQLEYFVAVAKHLHFGNAAKAVAVSQPALSAQIQQLEDVLGVKLFERTRRRVLLTDDGARLAVSARRVLRATDELVEQAVARGPLERTLRLGTIPTVAPYVLPRVMMSLGQRFPSLRLVLVEQQTASLVTSLRLGELDVLLLALPVSELDHGFQTRPLYEEPFVFACHPGHPLAQRPHVSVEALAGQEMLLLEEGHCLRDHALEVCRTVSAPENADIRATSMTTLIQMVEHGLGCTLLPKLATDIERRPRSQLVVRELKDPAPPSRTIGLAWRNSSQHHADFERFGAAIAEALNDATP